MVANKLQMYFLYCSLRRQYIPVDHYSRLHFFARVLRSMGARPFFAPHDSPAGKAQNCPTLRQARAGGRTTTRSSSGWERRRGGGVASAKTRCPASRLEFRLRYRYPSSQAVYARKGLQGGGSNRLAPLLGHSSQFTLSVVHFSPLNYHYYNVL